MIHTHYVYGRQHKVSLGPKRHQSVCNYETSGYNWLSVVLQVIFSGLLSGVTNIGSFSCLFT